MRRVRPSRRLMSQTLSLVSKATTQSIDPDTGAPTETVTETVEWTGKGSLQPNIGRDRESITSTSGGMEVVLVPFKGYLPPEAMSTPQQGWWVRDADGRDYPQVTKPLTPGGAGALWLLNLGPPNG